MSERTWGVGSAFGRPAAKRLAGLLVIVTLGGALACTEDPSGWPDGSSWRPHGDVVAVGDRVAISDSVPGDVMLAGQDLEFDGFSAGSYLGVSGSQSVAGRVLGSVRALGGSVRVGASVGRNVTLAGGSVVVGDEAEIEGNAYLAGGSVRLEGAVSGDVRVAAGEVVLDGEVGGDVRVESGSLRVGPRARIDGEVRFRLDEEAAPAVSAEAVVGGGLVALEPRADGGNSSGFFAFRLLAFVLLAAVVAAIVPGTLIAATQEMRDRPAAALGLGLLWVILVPVAVIVSAVTVIGIPLAVIVTTLYGLSLYLAPVIPALWVGDEIFRAREPSDRRSALLLVMTGGAVLAFAILLPWIGPLARVLATCAGLGAVVLVIERRRSSPQAP